MEGSGAPQQLMLCTLLGAVGATGQLRVSQHLQALSTVTQTHFERHEIVYEPLPIDRMKLNLGRLILWQEALEDAPAADNNWILRTLGRPASPQQHKCLLRPCLDVMTGANVRHFLTFVDYKFSYEFVQRGLMYRFASGAVAKIYQVYKLRELNSKQSAECIDTDNWIIELEALTPSMDAKKSEQNLLNVFRELQRFGAEMVNVNTLNI